MTEDTQAENQTSKIRERQQRRQEQQRMSRHIGGNTSHNLRQQLRRSDRFRFPIVRLPQNRLVYVLPAGAFIVVAVILVLASLSNVESETFPNALWLSKEWTYGQRSDEELANYIAQMKRNRIGTVFIFTSAIRFDKTTWTGVPGSDNLFFDDQAILANFLARFDELYPEAERFAWLEIQPDFSDPAVRGSIQTFSQGMIEQFGYDGILLDLKRLYGNQENAQNLLGDVRLAIESIRSDAEVAIVVPPDLTPDDANFIFPPMIAPGTGWSREDKQRIAIQADYLVVLGYHSYQQSPEMYTRWLAYQIDAYNDAITSIDFDTSILISVPLYESDPPAHDAEIENLTMALAGVQEGIRQINPEVNQITGIAIYADRDLTDEEWQTFSSNQDFK